MKNLPTTCNRRDHERGAIALVIAVMWTAMFGLAVIAVDFGYLYTKKRGIQSVTDSALKAAMPVYRTQGVNAAQTRARDIARLSGYEHGVRDTTVEFEEPAIGTQFRVTVGRTHPTFFGGVFGIVPRSIKASATGRITVAGTAAIHANDDGACAGQWDWGRGIQVTGGGLFTVNGNVQSKNIIHIGNPSGTCNGTNCRITGTVQTPCTFWNDAGPGVMGAPAAVGPSPTDPLAANTLATLEAACTAGTSTTTPMPGLPWAAGPCPGGSSLPAGVYCSSGDINVSPPSGATICPSTVSFIAGGTVTITGDGAITLTAAPGTNGIIAFSNAGMGGPAIQLSNGPALGNYTLNGSIYAPFGLVNVGTGTPGFTMTGILDGFAIAIAMGPGQPWTFNPPGGGGGGGGWTMLN
jgi:Putative Flp pilus-assembly TadE/G-like